MKSPFRPDFIMKPLLASADASQSSALGPCHGSRRAIHRLRTVIRSSNGRCNSEGYRSFHVLPVDISTLTCFDPMQLKSDVLY